MNVESEDLAEQNKKLILHIKQIEQEAEKRKTDIKEIEKKLLEAETKAEKAEKKAAEKEKALENKGVIDVDLKVGLTALRAKFTSESLNICLALQKLYLMKKTSLNERDNVQLQTFVRRSYQLSIIGIVWNEIFKIPQVQEKLQSRMESSCSLKLSEMPDIWDTLSEECKTSISIWISEFYLSDHVKSEANISQNLWGFILRKILMSLESSCDIHIGEKKLQCFGEYSTKNLKSMGGKFYTDFVYLAGCTGSPVFFVELAADPYIDPKKQHHSLTRPMHKDLKKMAIQMSQISFSEFQTCLVEVPKDCPETFIFPTLPIITYSSSPSEASSTRFDKYLQGLGLAHLFDFIENHTASQILAARRVFSRSNFILGIVMAIVKAHAHGFVFEKFTIEDITVRQGLYCIKTYKNAKPVHLSEVTLFDSLKSFAGLYSWIYSLERQMTEGDREYFSLRKLEGVLLGKIQRFEVEQETFDWIGTLTEAKTHYNDILVSLNINTNQDQSFVLLHEMLAELTNKSKERTQRQRRLHSESIENANPDIQNVNTEKLTQLDEPAISTPVKSPKSARNIKFI